MASIAFDSDAGPAARPPISAHPAFPAIVALWFSSLLGLGSMVLPAVLIERALEITGLAALVPALSPPLDLPARGLVALVAAAAGALLGLAIARRVAGSQETEPAPRFARLAPVGPRRPISVHEELGGEGVTNGKGLPVTRRRALAIAEDDRPSDFLYRAPLPGEAAFDPPAQAELDEEPLELSEALMEDEFTAPEAGISYEDDTMTDRQEFRPLDTLADEPAADELEPDAEAPEPAAGEPLPFSPPSLARRVDHHLQSPSDDDAAAPSSPPCSLATEPAPAGSPGWADAEPDGLGLVQLVQRLGHSIERRRAWLSEVRAAAPAALPLAVPEAFEAAPPEEAAQAMAEWFGRSDAAEADDQVAEPVAVEAEPAAPAPMPFAAPQMTAAARPRPEFLRALSATPDNEDEADDDVPSFSLPLRNPAAPDPAPEMAEEDDLAEEAVDDTSYGSLLAMNNPFAANGEDFVRIDEPEAEDVEPAVVFPQAAPPQTNDGAIEADEGDAPAQRLFDPPGKGLGPAPATVAAPATDTDAGLRAALATLQRMSGTA